MQEILAALEDVDSATDRRSCSGRSTCRSGRIEQALKLLEIDGAVARDGGRYSRTATPWEPGRGADRAGDRDAPRRAGRDAAYVDPHRLPDGVPDPAARRPGRRAVRPVRQRLSGRRAAARAVDRSSSARRSTFLRRDLRTIEPRKRWAADAVPGLSGSITPPNEPGVALSVYGDAGWGREVEAGQARRRFDPAGARRGGGPGDPGAVAAASPSPAWVTAVPSAGRGFPVGGFARALASKLGLPYVECFSSVAGGEPQEAMLNSVQQLRNAHRKLGDRRCHCPSGPGPARRRHRRLRLDDDRRRLAAADARKRTGPPVRPRRRRSARHVVRGGDHRLARRR